MEEYSEKNSKALIAAGKKWTKDFLNSDYSRHLSKEQVEETETITESFISYLYSFFALSLKDLNNDNLEEMCLEILPRKVSAEISYFKALTPVLTNFFSFLSKRGVMGDVSSLNLRLHEIQEDIIENATNPQNWGMAKSFVMDAIASEVDMDNQEEFLRFLNFKMYQHNLKQSVNYQSNRYVGIHKGKKIGRNHPCPCGSGQKYKKCCFDIRDHLSNVDL